jgi:hypothetical protein
MRNFKDWKTDEGLHDLLLNLQRKANDDIEVAILCNGAHRANQVSLLSSDKYALGVSIKLRELYEDNAIDVSSLDDSIIMLKENVYRRERYIENGCTGEF